MNSGILLRKATTRDSPALTRLLETEIHLHHHLDWRSAVEWLGYEPFWLLEKDGKLLAALACPPDPEGIYWIRLFVCGYSTIQPGEVWCLLFRNALKQIQQIDNAQIAALPLAPWFEEILVKSKFTCPQDIVVLEWNKVLPPPKFLPVNIAIHPMQEEDLPAIHQVDELSFMPIWQNSFESLRLAFQQSLYSTVAHQGNQIIGYQISTRTPVGIHLARLAVHPDFRRLKIGYALVRDLQLTFHREQFKTLSVNTQSDNHASLSLYRQIGFIRTGDLIPVYTFP
jgi:ribosomal-protein-alanine N-acetyltransferase